MAAVCMLHVSIQHVGCCSGIQCFSKAQDGDVVGQPQRHMGADLLVHKCMLYLHGLPASWAWLPSIAFHRRGFACAAPGPVSCSMPYLCQHQPWAPCRATAAVVA